MNTLWAPKHTNKQPYKSLMRLHFPWADIALQDLIFGQYVVSELCYDMFRVKVLWLARLGNDIFLHYFDEKCNLCCCCLLLQIISIEVLFLSERVANIALDSLVLVSVWSSVSLWINMHLQIFPDCFHISSIFSSHPVRVFCTCMVTEKTWTAKTESSITSHGASLFKCKWICTKTQRLICRLHDPQSVMGTPVTLTTYASLGVRKIIRNGATERTLSSVKSHQDICCLLKICGHAHIFFFFLAEFKTEQRSK